MKKYWLFALIFMPVFINANETETADNADNAVKKVKYEIQFANFDISVSNSIMPAANYLNKNILLDLNNLKSNLNINLNTSNMPISFRLYENKNSGIINYMGFGVSVIFETFGNAFISEKLLSFAKTNKDESISGIARFASINAPVYLNINKFKTKIMPSLFFPVVYGTPKIEYINDTKQNISYSMRLYTIGPFEDGFTGITAFPGIDLLLSAEYLLLENLDIGLEIINIPVLPSNMKDYMELSGYFNVNDSNGLEFDNLLEIVNNGSYGEDQRWILRPFKMLAKADWRPLENLKLSVNPVLGFSVNPLYGNPASIEGGVTANLDLKNFFILSLGINYFNRQFINSVDTVFYFTHFEFNLGLSLRAADFAQSWQGYGFGIKLGTKFRW